MSQGIFCRHGLHVTHFHGGDERGPCLQFDVTEHRTHRADAQLKAIDVKALMVTLETWLESMGYDPDNPVGFWKKVGTP